MDAKRMESIRSKFLQNSRNLGRMAVTKAQSCDIKGVLDFMYELGSNAAEASSELETAQVSMAEFPTVLKPFEAIENQAQEAVIQTLKSKCGLK